jgi:hypothetical protein
MLGTVKFSRFYGANRGAVDAIGRECTALKSVQNSFSGERFDYARGIPCVKQIWALRLDSRTCERSNGLPSVVRSQSESLHHPLAKTFRVLRPANGANVSQILPDSCQAEIAVLAEFKYDMGFCLGPEMSLEGDPVCCGPRKIIKKSRDGRVATVSRNEKMTFDHFIAREDLPARGLPDSYDGAAELDVWTAGDCVFQKSVVKEFSTDA